MTTQWTPRVDARVTMVEALLDLTDEQLVVSGLLRSDLEAMRDDGKACKAADRAQKTQFADIKSRVTGRKETGVELDAREDGFRNRLPLVVADLEKAGDNDNARWLKNLSFARYRLRELERKPDEAPLDDAEAAEVKKVERVERQDLVTRFDGLDAFVQAVVKRDPVLARFVARGLSKDALDALSADAAGEAKLGRNELQAAEASSLEAKHAKSMAEMWRASRRSIRSACVGNERLSKLLAAC